MPEQDDVDDVLAIIVGAVDATTDDPAQEPTVEGVAIGMTLTVGGSVISGLLIPNWRWFDETDTRMTVAGVPVLGEVFGMQASILREAREESKAARAEGQGGGAEDAAPRFRPAYIHLREARVYTGQQSVSTNGMHWRGRLSEVSGWCFGNMSADGAK